jgi:hypothetical protein
MQDILTHTPAVIVDDQLKGVVPFLPLNDVGRQTSGAPAVPAAPAPSVSPGASPGPPRVGATR